MYSHNDVVNESNFLNPPREFSFIVFNVKMFFSAWRLKTLKQKQAHLFKTQNATNSNHQEGCRLLSHRRSFPHLAEFLIG